MIDPDRSGATDPGASRALLDALDAVFVPLPPLTDVTERRIEADQTHRSVVVGETVVVKHLTPPVPPPHRAIRLARHLDAVGFGETPTTYGARYAGDDLVAVVAEFLPDAVDGWEWCVDAAVAGDPVGAAVGELCARLHVALATPSAVQPEPVTWVSGADWAGRAESALVAALDEIHAAWTDGPAADPDGLDSERAAKADAAWLAGAASTLRATFAELSRRASAPLKPSILGCLGDVRPDTDGEPPSITRGERRVAPGTDGRTTDRQPAAGQPADGEPAGGVPACGEPTAGVRAGGVPAGGAQAAGVQADGEPTGGESTGDGPTTGRHPVVEIHGDLHVGQILRWRGGLAVIDFDGNPTGGGDTPQPLARDVAQMVMSLAHVGRIAIRRHGADPAAIRTWTRTESERFLDAYRRGLGEQAHLYDERLVDAFAVEQECREIIYAARYRPTWRYAPMGALRDRFEEKP